MSKFITIDPGLGGTGVAVFSESKLHPEKTTVIKPTDKGHWAFRHSEIIAGLEKFLCTDLELEPIDISKAYIELPTMFQTAKGMSCATGKDGNDSDLVKLSVLVGRLYELFFSLGINVVLVPVNEWKGTMPKKVVISRIMNRLKCPMNSFPDHAADAVGIGLWVKGSFKANSLQYEVKEVDLKKSKIIVEGVKYEAGKRNH